MMYDLSKFGNVKGQGHRRSKTLKCILSNISKTSGGIWTKLCTNKLGLMAVISIVSKVSNYVTT